jgi:hypothetical protein
VTNPASSVATTSSGVSVQKAAPKPAITSFSLKEMMGGGVAEEKPVQVTTPINQVNEPRAEFNQQVTEQGVKEAWKAYAVSIEKENPRLFSILNNQIPTLENGVVLKLELRSQMQAAEVLKEKNALFLFLKERLKNSNLELSTSIVQEAIGDRQEVFTASDKLRVMMEKNPALAQLKQHFNLDLD